MNGHALARPAEYLDALRSVLERLDLDAVERIADLLLRARDRGRTVFIIGNGGSASTAGHMATDLCKVTAVGGASGVRALSLADQVSLLTAWANDSAYEHTFAEPLRAYLEPGDVLIAISASGRSANVVAAARLANELGATTIALTGFGGGELLEVAQLCLVADAHDYGLVEDAHLAINHALTAAIRARLQARVRANGARAA